MDYNYNELIDFFLEDIYYNLNRNLCTEVITLLTIGFLKSKGLSWQDSALIAQKRISERNIFENKFECITCSVGCADFLKIFLEKNSKHFDKVIVVTAPNDNDSIKVAEKYGATVFITDIFYKDGKKFDRGSAYNEALKYLTYKRWVCFVDVDIILDSNHREKILNSNLDKNIFYGIDRLNVITEEDRRLLYENKEFKSHLYCEHEWGFGYYQMFSMNHRIITHKIANKEVIYPSAEDVGLSDYLFRIQFGPGYMSPEGRWFWDDRFQKKLPVRCYHIGTNGPGIKSLTVKY